jgi:hypothetical protein
MSDWIEDDDPELEAAMLAFVPPVTEHSPTRASSNSSSKLLPPVPLFSGPASGFVAGGHAPPQPTADALWHQRIEELMPLFDLPPQPMDLGCVSDHEIMMRAPLSAEDDDIPLTQMSSEDLQDLLGRHVSEVPVVAIPVSTERLRSRSPRRFGPTAHSETGGVVTATRVASALGVTLDVIPQCCIAAFSMGGADERMAEFIGLEATRAMRRLPVHYQQYLVQMLVVSPSMWDNPSARVLEVVQTFFVAAVVVSSQTHWQCSSSRCGQRLHRHRVSTHCLPLGAHQSQEV